MAGAAATEVKPATKASAFTHAAAAAQRGEILSASEFAALLKITVSQFYRQQRAGAYVAFEVRPQVGPLRFSGARIARWMAGEAIAADVLPRYGRGSKGGAR